MAKQMVEEREPSLEEILLTIKNVISGDSGDDMSDVNEKNDQEPLELTEIVEDDGTISESKGMSELTQDVLDSIDNAVGTKSTEAEAEKPKPVEEKTPSKQEVKAEKKEEKIKVEKQEEVVKQEMREEEVIENKKDSLISKVSAAKSSEALQELMKSVPKVSRSSPGFRDGVTLEDIVIESLKPYLSEWLNENLPQIVKELVEKEIKKLVPQDID